MVRQIAAIYTPKTAQVNAGIVCNNRRVNRNGPMLATLVLLTILIAVSASADNDRPVVPADGRFSGFDARAYVLQRHPALAEVQEAISHWAAYYNVNPILLAHLVSELAGRQAPDSDSVRRLAHSLHRLDAGRARKQGEADFSRPELAGQLSGQFGISTETAERLIDQSILDADRAGVSVPMVFANDSPPAFDLPFARPQIWQFNGVHTWTGDDDGTPMSSLDFTRTWKLNWGDSTEYDWVSASHDGEVTVYSSCFAQVQHDSGWATRYYHMDNLQVVTGQRVKAGDLLGNYASQEAQALCSGGHSTGPHVHFALLKNGQYHSLQDIELSEYLVHPGNSSYDSSIDMWLEKRNERYFAFSGRISVQEGDNTIDYRYNGMWYSPENNGHGLNVEITEFPGEPESRKSVFLVLYTYDDSGQANFYVGNEDFSRWRSDETLVIDMLQTAGGDFTNLSAIDFDEPDQVMPAGQAEIGFLDCNRAIVQLDLDERGAGQRVTHSIELVKLIGVPEHVCEAASLPLH